MKYRRKFRLSACEKRAELTQFDLSHSAVVRRFRRVGGKFPWSIPEHRIKIPTPSEDFKTRNSRPSMRLREAQRRFRLIYAPSCDAVVASRALMSAVNS